MVDSEDTDVPDDDCACVPNWNGSLPCDTEMTYSSSRISRPTSIWDSTASATFILAVIPDERDAFGRRGRAAGTCGCATGVYDENTVGAAAPVAFNVSPSAAGRGGTDGRGGIAGDGTPPGRTPYGTVRFAPPSSTVASFIGTAASGAPHSVQNRHPSGFENPHC